jgi:hypothetical protein
MMFLAKFIDVSGGLAAEQNGTATNEHQQRKTEDEAELFHLESAISNEQSAIGNHSVLSEQWDPRQSRQCRGGNAPRREKALLIENC